MTLQVWSNSSQAKINPYVSNLNYLWNMESSLQRSVGEISASGINKMGNAGVINDGLHLFPVSAKFDGGYTKDAFISIYIMDSLNRL
jgi:hypothetical protein